MAIDPTLGEVTDEIQGLVAAGGKRLRPAFVYWGHRATGADHDEAVLRPAAAVELLHTFALLHDDVMDRSATRRGRPSAHASLAADHRTRGRRGRRRLVRRQRRDPRRRPHLRVGRRALRRHRAPGRRRGTGAGRVHHAPSRGHRRPVPRPGAGRRRGRPRGGGPPRRAPQVGSLHGHPAAAPRRRARTRRATAAAWPPRSGRTATPSAWPSRCATTSSASSAIPAVTGKSCLDDLREGKRTLLVLRALRLADRGAAPRARRRASATPTSTRRGPTVARQVVADTGALASVEALIAAHHAVALAAIASLPDAGPRRARRAGRPRHPAVRMTRGRHRRRRARRPVGRLPPGRRRPRRHRARGGRSPGRPGRHARARAASASTPAPRC